MTILLTQAIQVAGVTQPAGTTLTLEAGLEADLVTRKCATFVSRPDQGITAEVFARTDPLTGVIELLGPNGEGYAVADIPQNAPIVAAQSWSGDAKARNIDFGFEPDLVFVKGGSQYAGIFAKEYWYGNIQSFGHTALSGSDHLPGPTITQNGLCLIGTQAATNASGTTYHAVAVKDNGSGILKTFAYNGYTTSVGAGSAAVTMDLIDGSNPTIVHIKRDATGAGHEGVWATTTWAKKESAAAVNNALLTLSSGGSMSLSTDISVNENDGGNVGEGHNGFSLHNPGTYWEYETYVGTGSAFRIRCQRDVAAVFIIPQAALEMQFWLAGMGATSATGGQTALHSNRIGAGYGYVDIGTDASVNTAGTTYVAVILYKVAAPEKVIKAIPRPGLRVTTLGSGRVDCGTNASLQITGAHTLEWIGAVSADAAGGNEQFLMGRIGGAATGSRGTPAAGSCNFAMSYTRDPDAGIEICTSDQFSAEASNASKQKRWRTGVLLRPNELYHVAYTHDGTDKWILYINGQPVKWRRLAMSIFGLNGITGTAGLRMTFGGRMSSGSWAASERTHHCFGRVYNRALTAAEVQQMYARHFLMHPLGDISDTATALVEEWKFNEATATTVAATKTAGNNGAVTNMGWLVR